MRQYLAVREKTTEKKRTRENRKICGEYRASLTVEAALVFPMLMLILFLLIQATVRCYEGVCSEARSVFQTCVRNKEEHPIYRIRPTRLLLEAETGL